MSLKVILIVEDDAAIARLVQQALNGQPRYVALSVPDAAAATRVLAATYVDLLILDADLPGDGGLALYDRLRGRTAPAAPPCLFLSERDCRQQLARRGLRDFLPKPFEISELLERVHALLSAPDRPSYQESP